MEMINQIGSIAKYVWNVEMRLLHNYFDMLQTQQLSTWPKTSLHLLPLNSSKRRIMTAQLVSSPVLLVFI